MATKPYLNYVMRYIDGIPSHYSIFHADSGTHLGYLTESENHGWVYSCNSPALLDLAALVDITAKADSLTAG